MSKSTFGWYRPWLASIQDSQLPSRAKGVAAVLARLERDGVVKAPAGTIGSKASLDEKTVRRAIADLAADGWLTSQRSREYLVVDLRSGMTPELDRAPRPT